MAAHTLTSNDDVVVSKPTATQDHPYRTIFEDIVKARHSTRRFTDEPVSFTLLQESLALAQLAPSNSNTQPWRTFFASTKARDRLRDQLLKAASAEHPKIPPLPDDYKHYRSELGLQVYGEGLGIPRDDKEARAAAVLKNFEFFGAPHVGVICMEKVLEKWDAMAVGMYLQTLILALTARGVDTCLEVSIIGYPDIIRKTLGIGDELDLLCGIAIGYGDPTSRVNNVHTGREDFDKHVTVLRE